MTKRVLAVIVAAVVAACGVVSVPPVVNPVPPVEPPVVVNPPVVEPPPAEPVQWCEAKTEDQLRNIRADLGGVRLSVPTSATRGHYLFTPTYASMDAEMRALVRREYAARGYTHFILGPVYERGYPGWAGHDYRGRPEAWAALHEELWRDNLIPMLWVIPDGPYNIRRGEPGEWNNPLDVGFLDAELGAFFRHPEIQRTTCLVTLGWEVTDRGWIKTIGRARQAAIWLASVFPTQYRYWHAAVDNGAGCDYGEDGEGCERAFWSEIGRWFHGQFWQTGTSGGWNLHQRRDAECDAGLFPPSAWQCRPTRKPEVFDDRVAQFYENLQYEVMRFHSGHYKAGGIRGADGKLLDVIAGEYSAYFELNDGESEEWGRAWGRRAMTVPGVRGYGDGGVNR